MYQYCNALWCFGRVREGVEIIEQAVARDPLEPRMYVLRAKLLFAVNRTADSIASLRRAVALRPQFDGAHSYIGDTLVLTGRPAEAIPEYEKVSNAWDRIRGLAIARAKMGDRAGSNRELAELKKLDDGSLNFQFAEVYAQRAEQEQAVLALEAAYSALDSGLQYLGQDPLLGPVRSNSRVQALMKRLSFPV